MLIVVAGLSLIYIRLFRINTRGLCPTVAVHMKFYNKATLFVVANLSGRLY